MGEAVLSHLLYSRFCQPLEGGWGKGKRQCRRLARQKPAQAGLEPTQRERERPGRAATEAAATGGRRPGPGRAGGERQGRPGPRSAPRGGGRGRPERAGEGGGGEGGGAERGEPTER